MYTFTQQQLCLWHLSADVWFRRGSAKNSGLSLNEETLTEVLLLDMALRFPGSVSIVPFNRRQEARIGADWAWAFVGPDEHCQGMLVQAKRLNDAERHYNELNYTPRSSGSGSAVSQTARLIANATRLKLPPVYAFYNHLSDTTRLPWGSCGSVRLTQSSAAPGWGVAIASAINVRNSRPDKTFDHHRCHSRPLHCLLCSFGTGRQHALGSAGAAAAGLSALFEGTSHDALGMDLRIPFEPTSGLPDFFQRVERAHQSRRRNIDADLADFEAEFTGIAGAAIIRDGQSQSP